MSSSWFIIGDTDVDGNVINGIQVGLLKRTITSSLLGDRKLPLRLRLVQFQLS